MTCAFLSVHLCFSAISQTNFYWQQQVNYNIDVTLNDVNKTLSGFEKLEYFNNSPDTLHYIWFHIWPNAYKDETSAFYQQLGHLSEGKEIIQKFKERGYIDSLSFKADGETIRYENHPQHNDVIKLLLNKPLYPGQHIILTTPFFVKIPSYISRFGHDGNSFMITQWYPKPAVYDRKGWHEMPYLDIGEFYSEYGTFDVRITVPSAYVVAATGLLQTEKERSLYQSIGKKNKDIIASNNGNTQKIKSQFNYYGDESGGVKTLSWHADSVHDFAWFADKQFVINYDTLQLASGKVIDAYTFYHSTDKQWYNSEDDVEDVIRHYSAWIGEYEYPAANAVAGPANSFSGGMEYPMITLITDPKADEVKLDGLLAHEVGHNWFYSILASNERDHAWMDEGINTYYQFRYEHAKYKTNSIFGDAIPKEVREKPVDELEGVIYMALAEIPMDREIDLPAEEYANKDEYGMVVYIKTAIWMYLIELMEGREPLDKGLKAYFEKWKFKHPYPEDFRAVMEETMGKKLDTYFDLLKKKGSLK